MWSRIASAALLLAGTSSVFAVPENPYELDTVVVTATRIAQSANESLAPVTVITRKEIERSQAQSAADLLVGQPAVSIANNGGPGKTTSLFLRGTNADHVVVLVDGTRIGSATTGTAALQDIPAELIDRIEVVRGPRSSLYGADAIGGVIQIFTHKGYGASRPSLSIGGGSYGSWHGSAALSGGLGSNGWYNLGLSALDTNGFNACNGRPAPNGAGCYVYQPDRDGYRNQSGRLRAGWRFDNGTQAEVNWLRTQGHNQYDGSSVNASESTQQVLGANLSFAPTGSWLSSLRASQSQDDSDNFKDSVFKSRFNTRRDQFSWQNDIELAPAQQLVAGIDWQNDHVVSSTVYAVSSRSNNGVFAQYLAAVDGHDFELSARRDDNQQFGARTTGAVAWGHNLASGLRLTASYGTAFKAPTFNQLYYPGFGNAGLHPEQSGSLDFGLAGKTGAGNWSIHVFETRITDLIGFDAAFNPVNIDEARISGLETVAATQAMGWDLQGSLTLLDPRNLASGANHGHTLPRRARQSLSLNADRDFGRWSAGATFRGVGQRNDDLANTVKLGGYATLDLHAEYRWRRDWRLQVRVENMFDKEFETAYLFNQPRRSAYVTLRYPSL